MNIDDLHGKMVGVLGFGVEGRATAGYLIKHGVKPVLFDARPWEEWEKTDQEYIKSLGLNFIFGPDWAKELKGFDVVFRSPGIRLSDVRGSNFATNFAKATSVKKASSDKHVSNVCAITSQTKWFFEHCPAKIIGVTGTKGKGTTSTLIYEIVTLSLRGDRALSGDEAIPDKQRLLPPPLKLRRTGRSDTALPRNDSAMAYLIGNIGQTQPFEILDGLNENDLIVYELSSFQLQDLTQSPHIAVVLMTTQEHLDYHKDVAEYHEAKASITKFQSADDFAIYNIDYPASVKIGEMGKGKKIPVSGNDLTSITDIQLRGRHNLENIRAAMAVAEILNIDSGLTKSVISNFRGLEHRLEFVAEKNGIKFYNDSFSTTPETAIAAINAFTEPEIVILGGSSKNSDFTELGKIIADKKNIKALILIGQEAGRIWEAIEKGGGFTGKVMRDAATMQEIFGQIRSVAAAGDIILLTPACASFGMFKNYKDRGEQFKKEVMGY